MKRTFSPLVLALVFATLGVGQSVMATDRPTHEDGQIDGMRAAHADLCKPDSVIKGWQVLNMFDQQPQGTAADNVKQLFVISDFHADPSYAKSCYENILKASESGRKVNFYQETDWERVKWYTDNLPHLIRGQTEEDFFTSYCHRFGYQRPENGLDRLNCIKEKYWILKIMQLAQDQDNVRVIPVDGHYTDVLECLHRECTLDQWNKLARCVGPGAKKVWNELVDWGLIDSREQKYSKKLSTLEDLKSCCEASFDCLKALMTYEDYSSLNCNSIHIRDRIMADNIVKDIKEDTLNESALNIALVGHSHTPGVSKGFLEKMS